MGLADEIKAEREFLKNAPLKKKIQYLLKYYKFHCVVLFILLVITVINIYSAFTIKDTVLSGIMLNCVDTISKGACEELEESFIESMQLNPEKVKVELESSLTYLTEGSANSVDSYVAVDVVSDRTAKGMLDFVTGDLDTLSALAYSEFFVDLSTVLTEEQMKQYEPYFLYIDLAVIERLEEIALSKDYAAEFSVPDSDKPDEMKNPIPVFIDISASERINQIYSNEQDRIVFAVAVNALREKAVCKFVDFLMGE